MIFGHTWTSKCDITGHFLDFTGTIPDIAGTVPDITGIVRDIIFQENWDRGHTLDIEFR